MIKDFTECKEHEAAKEQFETIRQASQQANEDLRANVTEWTKGFETDYNDMLVVSLAQVEDTTDFWFAELPSSSNMALALQLEKPAKLDLAIGLALLHNKKKKKKKAHELQLTSRIDCAQRSCCKFLRAFSAMLPVGRACLVPAELEFESNSFQLCEEVHANVHALELLVNAMDPEVVKRCRAAVVVSQAISEKQKLLKLLVDRWDMMCQGLSDYLCELHPKERIWREYCIHMPDKDK